VSAFPSAHHLSIALFADKDADALDVERGAAVPSDIPGWYARQRRRGIARPCIYASASTMQASVIPAIRSVPVLRSAVRLWTAHYEGEHICGPKTCAQLSFDADGTQWTPNALGRNLDQSRLLDDFFGTPPVQSWEDKLMTVIPVIRKGSTSVQAVKNWQGLLVARGYSLGTTGERKDGIDGTWGGLTQAQTLAFQKARGLKPDGEVGQYTWAAALTVP
jgi:hypothetical protein